MLSHYFIIFYYAISYKLLNDFFVILLYENLFIMSILINYYNISKNKKLSNKK